MGIKLELLCLLFVFLLLVHHSHSTTYTHTYEITDDATFSCHFDIKFNENTQVIWIDPKQDVISIDEVLRTIDDRFTISTPQKNLFELKLSKVKKEDEGAYACKAMVGENRISQHTFILHIQTPPEMLSPHNKTIVAKEETDVALECKAEGDPEPTLSWAFRDPHSQQEHLLETEDPSVLIVSKVNISSNGLYVCTAQNGVRPNDRSIYNLVVETVPQVQVPYVKVSQETNRNLILQCIVHWNPEGTVEWTFNENSIISTHKENNIKSFHGLKKNPNRGPNKSTNGKYSLMKKKMSSTTTIVDLVIKNFKKHDIGIYKCKANNGLGTNEAEIIALSYESSISKEIDAMVGENVIIACKYMDKRNNHNTSSEVVWWRKTSSMKNFEKIDENDPSYLITKNFELKLNSVTVLDSGFYKCSLEDVDQTDGELEEESIYLSITQTSASSSLTDEESYVSVKTLIISLVCVVVVMVAVFVFILLLLKKKRGGHSFNAEASRLKS